MSVIGSNVLAGASGQSAGGAGGFAISRSLRFNASDSANLSRTPSSAGNRKTWTWSGWVKRSKLGDDQAIFAAGPGNPTTTIRFSGEGSASPDGINIFHYAGSFSFQLTTTAQFRDLSSWYHVVVACDTTQATASDRLKLYVNGEQVTAFDTETYPSQNFDTQISSTVVQGISKTGAGTNYFNGYLAEVNFIDGQALAPTDFGETNTDNLWVPKEFSGTYGPLVDQSQTWSNGWSLTSGSWISGPNLAFDGVIGSNTTQNRIDGDATWTAPSSIAFSSLRIWGFKAGTNSVYVNGTDVSSQVVDGTVSAEQWNTITGISSPLSTIRITGNSSNTSGIGGVEIDGILLVDTSVTVTDNSFHLDFADNSSNAALGTDTSGNSNTWTVNNLTASVPGLATANQGMDVVTYTGNGTTNTAISGLAFQPDFVWIKARSAAYDHMLNDSVRGATKSLRSNLTDAEGTNANDLQSFDTNGFTVGYGGYVNGNNVTFTAWCWKAGGTASSNTDGTITSSVSANNTYGFSIASWTSDGTDANKTIGHGLSSAPKFIIVKSRDEARHWLIWHENFAGPSYAALFTDGAPAANRFGPNAPTSSVFGVYGGQGNRGTTDFIAYCWSEIIGFSKFGSYTGGTNPKTITTGFKPAFLLIKRIDGSNQWVVIDSKRGGTKKLSPNLNVSENDGTYLGGDSANTVEFLSDGFKLTSTNAETNGSGQTHIYAAFASKPSGEGIDSLLDTPTNGDTASDTGAGGQITGCYATWNPLVQSSSTFSNGNLQATTSGGSGYPLDMADFYTPAGTGKWYWEFELSALSGSNYTMVGMLPGDSDYQQGASNIPQEKGGISIYVGYNGSVTAASGAATAGTATATFAVGDILGWAFDAENGTLQCYKNGVSQGTQFTNIRTNIGWVFCVTDYDNSATATYVINFGQRAFAYAAPSGYKSLNTANLPEPTIADGSKYFDTKLYTGNGSTQAISGMNMSPDLIWAKGRNTSSANVLVDSVRGVQKSIFSDQTTAELDRNSVTAFNSDGFTLGDYVNSNGNTNSYVAWAWDAGDSNTTIAAGGLNSSVYDQSQTWSNHLTASGSGFRSGNPATNAFNGGSQNAVTNDNNGTLTLDLSSYNLSGLVRVKFGTGNSGTYTATFVGSSGTQTDSKSYAATQPAAYTSSYNVGTITSVSVTTTSNSQMNLVAVEIDGKELVDYGVTPPNVPSIASTVRANPSAGFSIVSFTDGGSACTVGHGLNSAPEMIWVKFRGATGNWAVYHKSIGNDHRLKLNLTDAKQSGNDWWNATSPTNSVFSLGSNLVTSTAQIAYCFAPVAGYSAMGSFVGGSSPFVYTGFRPKFLLVKSSSANTSNWIILDSERSAFNEMDDILRPDLSSAEVADQYSRTDFLSNGFKIQGSGSTYGLNGSGVTYIYLAFASHPFASNGGLAR